MPAVGFSGSVLGFRTCRPGFIILRRTTFLGGAGCSVDIAAFGAVGRSVAIIGAVGAANEPLGKGLWRNIVLEVPSEARVVARGCWESVGSNCFVPGRLDRGVGMSNSDSASCIARIRSTSSSGTLSGRERDFLFRSVRRGDSSIWCRFRFRPSLPPSGRSFCEFLLV